MFAINFTISFIESLLLTFFYSNRTSKKEIFFNIESENISFKKVYSLKKFLLVNKFNFYSYYSFLFLVKSNFFFSFSSIYYIIFFQNNFNGFLKFFNNSNLTNYNGSKNYFFFFTSRFFKVSLNKTILILNRNNLDSIFSYCLKKLSFFPSIYKIKFSVSDFFKNLNSKTLSNMNILFLRKTKVFNKGRYSRNRQYYRTGVYWCLYVNIIAVVGIYFWFYRFNMNFGYLWWILYIFLFSFFFSRGLSLNLIGIFAPFRSITKSFFWFFFFLSNFLIYLKSYLNSVFSKIFFFFKN